MTNVCLTMEDFTWNRIAYDVEANSNETVKLHNHAFIHSPECVRTCLVTLNRRGLKVFHQRISNLSLAVTFSYSPLDMIPNVVSGIKNLRLAKTAQTTFAGFHRDEYTTLQNIYEKVLRLVFGAL